MLGGVLQLRRLSSQKYVSENVLPLSWQASAAALDSPDFVVSFRRSLPSTPCETARRVDLSGPSSLFSSLLLPLCPLKHLNLSSLLRVAQMYEVRRNDKKLARAERACRSLTPRSTPNLAVLDSLSLSPSPNNVDCRCLIPLVASDYHPRYLAVNLPVCFILLLAKSPLMHRVRILHINATPGIDDRVKRE